MRKVLFAILAIVLLIFTGFVIYRGTNIGKFEIWGIKQINEENDVIDQKNADLGTLVNVSYPEAISKLNNSGEVMEENKKEYEEQATMISNSKYLQKEKYKLEFLWTKIGNYAKDNNVTPKMQVTNGSTKEVYNLIITAVGRYSNVASFIYAIENDSRLGFKIEDFKMTRASIGKEEETNHYVQGTFTCKEIRIDLKSLDSDSSNETKTNSTNNTNGGNTNTTATNTTNTAKGTNTTNTTATNNNTTTNTAENKTENATSPEQSTVDTENQNEDTEINPTP
ncbi:MAG: hypothetical protein IJK18_07500 [Clostridia bacterium]|nr:hypothetical protein [Clostridia bacterium]